MKRLFKFGLVVLVLIVIAVATIPIWVDGAVQKAIEKQGTAALGVTTEIESVSIAVFGGEASLRGLKIGNVDGYAAPHFMHMDSGRVAVTLGSLTEDTIVIPELVIDGVDLRLERKGDGANYEKIVENLEKNVGGDDAPKDATDGKKFVIKSIVIRNINVEAYASLTGLARRPVTGKVNELRFENIGSETDGGAVLAVVVDKIVSAVLAGVLKSNIGLPMEITKGLGRAVGDVGFKIVGEGGNVLVGVGGGVVKGVGKGVGKVVEGIGGIFDKDK